MLKKSILKSLILLILLVLFIIFQIQNNEINSYKILKIIEADKFYVDFNNDGLMDTDELINLQDILAFSPNKNSFTSEIADSCGMNINDFMKNGYLARAWAKDTLENKYIEITNKKIQYTKYNKYTFIKAKLNGRDLGQILLENGFAIAYKNNESFDYFQAQNLKSARENALALDKIKFLIINKSNNTVHKLSCEYADKILNAELILEKNLKNFNLKKCKICFETVSEFIANVINFKSKKSYKTSVYAKFDDIEIFLINPLEYKKPSSGCSTKICRTIVNEINSAKTSIDVALYGFSSQDEIFKALKNAKARGVNIRAVMDYSKNLDTIYKDSALFAKEFDAVCDKTETLMHNKFFIFDDKKVLTGSMNISSTGSGGYNANIMALINSPELAKTFKSEFNEMHSGKFQQKKKKINSIPIKLANSTVTAYFSPKSDVYKNAILPMIENARKEIFVSIFYLTDKRLVDELIKARKRGVNVVILWDALGAGNFKNLFNDLRKEKVTVKAENWGGKNHEKTILADDKLLIGSSNFSLSGFNKNDENVIVIENKEIAELWGDYFKYLFNSVDNKYLNYIPRAESFESKNSCTDGIDNNFDGFTDKEDEGCKVKK